jgi:hypothetical protein
MEVSTTHDCKYIKWHWLNVNTGEIKPFNCGSWSCNQHRSAVAYHWACRIAEASPQRMFTLTNIPHNKTEAYLGFQQLIRDIRAEGMAIEYARFFELGSQTGMRHFHLAQKGDYIPVRWLSKRASANGLGKIVYAEECYGAGPAFYLGKYITKDDFSLTGWRKVASSKHFFPEKELPADLRDDWTLIKS